MSRISFHARRRFVAHYDATIPARRRIVLPSIKMHCRLGSDEPDYAASHSLSLSA